MADTGKVLVVDPTTGQTREADATEAQEGFQAGKLQLPHDQEIHMTAQDGTVMVAPSANVQRALESGWRFANKEEILRKQAEGQQGRAALEGALSELTLGGSDVAAQQLGVEGLKERRETTGGQVGRALGFGAGLFGPGLLEQAVGQGAKGLAAHAAEAALAPMRALTAAGDAVTEAATKAFAGQLENQTAARVAGAVVGRGVEGAAFGAGGAMSEESLGDPNANAQHLLAAGGMGALLGFGVGGAVGGGLRGLGDAMEHRAYVAGRKAQAESVGARGYGSPEEFRNALETSQGEPLEDGAWAKLKNVFNDKIYKPAVGALHGEQAVADLEQVSTKRAQEILRNGEHELDASGREMVGVMEKMAEVQKAAGELGYGSAKRELLSELMPKGAAGSVVAQAGRQIEGLHSALDAIERDAAAWGLGADKGAAAVKPYREMLNEAEDRLMKKAGIAREYTVRTRREVPGGFELEGGGVPEKEWQARKAARAAKEASFASPRDQLLAAAQDLHVDQGNVNGRRMMLKDLRARSGLPTAEFDQAAKQLEEEGHAVLYRSDSGPEVEAHAPHAIDVAGNKRHLMILQQPGLEEEVAGRAEAGAVPKLPRTPMIQKPQIVEEVSTKTRGLKDLGDGPYDIPDSFVTDVYERMNEIKQAFQKPASFGQEVSGAASRNLKDAFQDAYQQLRNHLEDDSVYGEAGKLQRDINEAYAARERAWGELAGDDQNPARFRFDGRGRVEPASVQSHIKNIDRLRGDRAIEALDSWQAANVQYADALNKYFKGNAVSADAKVLNDQFSKVRARVAEQVQVHSASRRLISNAQRRFGFGGNAGVVAGSVLGALTPLGAMGAVLGESLLNPGRAALMRANLAHTLERVKAHIGARVEKLVTGSKALVPSLPTQTRALSRATTAMLEAKTPEARRKAYDERVDELTQLSDPRTFGDHVAQQTLGLSEIVPQHAQAMTTTAATALGILNASLPSAAAGTAGDGGPFDLMHAKPRPHDRDILKFAQVDQAVQDPLSILDAAEKGYIFQHQLDAVEQAHPAVLQAVRMSLVTGAGKTKGPMLSSRSRVAAQLLGAGIVPAGKIQRYQAVHSMPQPQPPAPAGSPRVKSLRSAELLTSTDKLDNYPK